MHKQVSVMARMVISSGLTLLAGTQQQSYAGAWYGSGTGQVGGGYDDNVRLTSVNKVSAWQDSADLSGNLLYQDDAFQWQLVPRLLSIRYDGAELLNRTEEYVSMLTQRQTALSSSSLVLNGVADTTLTSELGLTGFSEVNKKHRSASATFNNSWSVTERVDTQLQFYASANRYIDAQGTGLFDYNYGSAALSASVDLTERSKWSLQASLGKLQVPDVNSFDKTNLSITLGYSATWWQRWLFNAAAGPSQIRDDNGTTKGAVYSAALTRKAEVMDVNLSLTRDVTPTGQGVLSQRDQLRLGFDRNWNERWSTSWSVAGIRTRNVGTLGLDQQTVTYTNIAGNLGWRITPTLSLSMAAGYTRQVIGNSDVVAARRHGALSISWRGLQKRLH